MLTSRLRGAREDRASVHPGLGGAITMMLFGAGLAVGGVVATQYVSDNVCEDQGACTNATRYGKISLIAVGAALGTIGVIRITVHAVRRARAGSEVRRYKRALDEFDRAHPLELSVGATSSGLGAGLRLAF